MFDDECGRKGINSSGGLDHCQDGVAGEGVGGEFLNHAAMGV